MNSKISPEYVSLLLCRRDASLGKQDLDHIRHGVGNQQGFLEWEHVVPRAPSIPKSDVVVMELGLKR